MELRILGPLEIVDDAGRTVEIRGAKVTGLLVLLALRAGEVVPMGRIIEELWGEQEIRDPVNAAQVVVSKLRRALQPEGNSEVRPLIATTAVGYSLDLDPVAIDAVRFERLAVEGRRRLHAGDAAAAVATLRDALAMWRGPALLDFVDNEFAYGDRIRLDELRAATIEQRIDADLALGNHAEIGPDLEALIAEYPLRERLRAQQMLALYRAGRQADALRAYQATRTLLGEELGLEPGPELRQLEAAILAQDPALDAPTAAHDVPRHGNLPAPISSFIGREEELAQVCELLHDHRLVTLMGPGGVGKTRLALEAAARVRDAQPDGCWLVELAPLTDPAHVEAAAATALGVDDVARLDDFLAGRRTLVILDNCEHLIGAAAALASRLLRAGPRVTVLATSREGLGVVGEHRWNTPPLSSTDAQALFADRAVDADVTGRDARSARLVEICDRLDGLPLAVELAAARTRTLSLDDIATRIDDRFRLLTTGDRTAEPRQQTLRGVVDWSYDLLFTDEQRVFRRLAVFAGGFGVRAAELVAAGADVAEVDVAEDEVLDLVGHLVDKSLVVVTNLDGETRYQLLQTLIDYGRWKLDETDEHSAARDRHLDWVIGLAAQAEPALRGSGQYQWASVLATERDNIRGAVEWALEHDRADDAVGIVAGMGYGWYISGATGEGRDLLDTVLAHAGASSPERAIAHAWAAWLTQFSDGMSDAVVDHAEQAVELARTADPRVFSIAAVIASLVRGVRGLTVEAAQLIDDASVRLEREPNRWGRAWVDWARSGLALKGGDPDAATELLRRSVVGFEAEGDRCGAAIVAIRLSELAEGRGDLELAIASATSAYDAIMQFGARAFNASTLATRLGNLAALQARFDDAAEWHAQALDRAHEGAYPGAVAQALSGMAHAAARQEHLDEAESRHREALAVYTSAGSVEGVASALASLGSIATTRGDHRAGRKLHGRSLREASRGNDRRATANAVEGIAGADARAGDGHSAALLLGAAAEIRRVGGSARQPPTNETQRTEDEARALIGDRDVAAARAEGAVRATEIVERLLASV